MSSRPTTVPIPYRPARSSRPSSTRPPTSKGPRPRSSLHGATWRFLTEVPAANSGRATLSREGREYLANNRALAKFFDFDDSSAGPAEEKQEKKREKIEEKTIIKQKEENSDNSEHRRPAVEASRNFSSEAQNPPNFHLSAAARLAAQQREFGLTIREVVEKLLKEEEKQEKPERAKAEEAEVLRSLDDPPEMPNSLKQSLLSEERKSLHYGRIQLSSKRELREAVDLPKEIFSRLGGRGETPRRERFEDSEESTREFLDRRRAAQGKYQNEWIKTNKSRKAEEARLRAEAEASKGDGAVARRLAELKAEIPQLFSTRAFRAWAIEKNGKKNNKIPHFLQKIQDEQKNSARANRPQSGASVESGKSSARREVFTQHAAALEREFHDELQALESESAATGGFSSERSRMAGVASQPHHAEWAKRAAQESSISQLFQVPDPFLEAAQQENAQRQAKATSDSQALEKHLLEMELKRLHQQALLDAEEF